MPLLLLFFTFTMLTTPVIAEGLPNRKVEIVDGRSDKSNSAPLVIVLHAFLERSETIRKKTNFDALAQKHGFIVAYPDGVMRRWNDGRSPRNKVDDVAYLSALISTLTDDGRVDASRVYLAGHSNGGGMAMRMACDRASLVRGIAVIATKTPARYRCEHGSPVPTIIFHGTADPIAPSAGRAEDNRLGGALSADAMLELLIARNGCSGASNTRIIDQHDDGTTAEVRKYSGCQASLIHVLIHGHGHAWPGAGERFVRLQGPATREVDAAVISWRFFQEN